MLFTFFTPTSHEFPAEFSEGYMIADRELIECVFVILVF